MTTALAMLCNALPPCFTYCFPDKVIYRALELIRLEIYLMER